MDTDKYITFLATPGGKTHTVAKEIREERIKAQAARVEYLKSKGEDCLDLFGSECSISALIYKPGKIPAGWRRDAALSRKHTAPDGGVFAVPDGKNKDKDTYKRLISELRAITALPGAETFTKRIGSSFIIIGRCFMNCWFERIGETFVVMVPRVPTKHDEEAVEIMGGKPTQFVPPDCTELKLSEYYRIKEEHEAAKKAAATP